MHTIVSVAAAAGVNLTVTNTHSHTRKITRRYTYSHTCTHTTRACARARALGTRAGLACYISENRNGPTAGRPLSQSLISMCFFSSLFIFLSYFAFFISLPLCYRPTTASDRALCYILVYIHTCVHTYIYAACIYRTNPVPTRHACTHYNNDDIYICAHIYIYIYWTAGRLTFGQHDPIANFFHQINPCIDW